MKIETSERGFHWIVHETRSHLDKEHTRLLGESSAIDSNIENGLAKPGSFFLWVGQHHRLDREQVAELVEHLQRWLETGSLEADDELIQDNFDEWKKTL